MRIQNHRKSFLDYQRDVKRTRNRINRELVEYFAARARELARQEERDEKERIMMLRANDEDAYRQMIDKKRHGRLHHLLEKTDEYMASIMTTITDHQTKEQEEEEDAAFNADVAVALDSAPKFDNQPVTERLSAGAPNFSNTDLMLIAQGEKDHQLNKPGGADGRVKNKYGEAHKIMETVTKQADILVNGELKEYQVKGLEWMVSLYNNKLNGILADEMGLGKTIQTISLITYLMETKHNNGPYLIIVPLSTLSNWVLEFDKWAPSVTYIPYKGVPAVRRRFQKQIESRQFNVLLTTYEFVLKDKAVLGKLNWKYMIIDEGHRLKNKEGKLSKILSKYYKTARRLLLSGTPLQNNLPELWALLNFLLPDIFKSADSFDEWFAKPFTSMGEKVELSQEENMLIIQRLHKVLRPFLLRRLKSEVEAQLPQKTEYVLKCEMSALQKRIYHHMQKHGVILSPPDMSERDGGIKSKAGGVAYMNNTIMQLRKICNHPFLFKSVDHGWATHTGAGSNDLTHDLWRSCGKFELLDRMLPKLFAQKHRVLIFSQMVELLFVLGDYCTLRSIKYMKLDGSTPADEREKMIKEFNAEDSPYQLFILSTRAGGVGVNLQTADTVIIYDSDWNPHQDLQAQDRAHRIGQRNEVRVFRLLTVNSVEESILEIARYKLSIDDQVIQAGKYNDTSTSTDRYEYLKKILGADDDAEEGAAAEDADEEGGGPESEVPDDAQLNDMLARGDHELVVFETMDREREAIDKQQWLMGQRHTRLMQDHELPPWYV